MEFIKIILESNIVEGFDIERVMTAIKAEAPKHTIPKTVFNETNDKLKEANLKLGEMQTTIVDLGKSNGDVEDLKQKLVAAGTEFETYKNDTTKRENTRIKKDAFRDLLLSDKYNANPDAIKLLEKSVDFDSMSIDTNGVVIGLTDLADSTKENNKFAFLEVQTAGTPAGQGVAANKGTKATMIEKYNSAEKSRDVSVMAAIQQQINNLEE